MINFRDSHAASRKTRLQFTVRLLFLSLDYKAVNENRKNARVYIGVFGDLTYLIVGQFRGVFFFGYGHDRHRPAKLFEFVSAGRLQHRQFARTPVILELPAKLPAVLVVGEEAELL